ncbi:MAG: hypothetical protein KAH06_09655 [Desulfobacterales bacterium]|nr:hypothetical protein [Desulfobacterales bacterium]
MKQLLISFFLIFALAGCMMEPYKQAFNKDCGPYPEHYLEIINGFLAHDIENPKSIQNLTVIKPPDKKVLENEQESISLAKGHEVWECFIAFDAKNRNNKIVRDFHVVWIRNGRIMAYDYQKPELNYRFEHRLNPTPANEAAPKESTMENPEEKTEKIIFE